MRIAVPIALFAALFTSCAASALTITAMRKHDPGRAPTAIGALIADIDSNDPARLDAQTFIYTDALGYVTYDEEAAFLKAMNSSDGREDRSPIKVARVKLLARDKFYPVYLVTIEREVWKLKEFETDGCANVTEHDRPHWETSRTTWVVSFESNDIATLREADELVHAMR